MQEAIYSTCQFATDSWQLTDIQLRDNTLTYLPPSLRVVITSNPNPGNLDKDTQAYNPPLF